MLTKKLILSAILAISFLFGHVSSVLADRVAAKGGLIFIADNGLMVKNIADGQPNACIEEKLLTLSFDNTTLPLLKTATDVTVEDGYAVITIHRDTDSDGKLLETPVTDALAIDVSSCLDTSEDVPVQECISTVDLDQGILIIPCVEIEGSVSTVHMEQRGSSSNWEVSFLGVNPALNKVKLHDDDEDDISDPEEDSSSTDSDSSTTDDSNTVDSSTATN